MASSFLFQLEPHVPLAEAEMSLHLAMFAVEGLAGRARVRLDSRYQLDAENHVIRVDGGNRIGSMVARIFAGLLLREFGEDAFYVEHVIEQPNPKPEEVRA
jgi:hypothetical protein